MSSWPFKSSPESSCQGDQAANAHRNKQGWSTFTQKPDERKERGDNSYRQSSHKPSRFSPFIVINSTFDLLVYDPFGVKPIISNPPTTGLLSTLGSGYLCHLLLQRRYPL